MAEEYVDCIDDGLCTFHCNCGKIIAPVEIGEDITCSGCGKSVRVKQEIKIEQLP